MKAIIVNLIKSFWLTKGKFILCVLAAALSAWGISTMVYSYLMTERDFEENFARSNPPDLILTLEDPDSSLLQKIRNDSRVLDMERREAVVARIRNRNGNWMFILLFGVDDMEHPRIGKYDPLETKGPGIFIEKNGMSFLAQSRDSLTIQMPGLQPLPFAFAGKVHDPGQAPSQMEQALYGYTPISTLQPFLGDGKQRFLITTKIKGMNTVELTSLGKEFVSWAEGKGLKASLTVPPPGEHPHQGIVDGISFLQKSFGSILSLIGAILLSLILITWLYPQIANVGIMKAIGASTPMIFTGYLTVLLLIISLGMLIGLPLGYKTGTLYNAAVAFIQNFTPVTRPLPLYDHLFVIIPVILIPTLFALIPLLKASRTTVHDALSHVFYTPYKFIFKVTQSLGDTRLKYSMNNLFRSNQRTTLLIVLLTSGIALFITGSNLRYSLKSDFAKYAEDSGYGISIGLKDSTTAEFPFLTELPFVESASYINIRSVRFKLPQQSYEESLPFRTFPPDYRFDPGLIIRGTLKKDCDDCIYVTQRYQNDFESVATGSPFELKFQDKTSRTFVFSGIVKDITHPGFYRFSTSKNTSSTEIAVRITKDISPADAAGKIDDAFLENNIEVRMVADAGTRLAALENHLAPMYLVIQVMGVVTIFIALAGLLIVLNLSIQERAREMGIMKSLGATVGSAVAAYHREYFVVTFLAILAGSVIGYVFNVALCNLFGVMVINSPVKPLNDIRFIAVAAAGVLGVQWLMITWYVRYKVSKTSSRLLTEVV